jgi:hypothetical protein
VLLSLVTLLVVDRVAAQTTAVDIGAAVGRQSYADSLDDPRILTSLDLVARRGSAGIELAVEYADLSEEGALVVAHPDIVYRWQLPANFALLAGAGPTWVSVGAFDGSQISWNAEIEIERRWRRFALFGRVRQYDYDLPRFRESGPDGPAMYVGFRVKMR